MKIDVLDTNGKSVGNVDLDATVFGIEPNVPTVNQYLRVYQLNQRQGTSSSKTRGDVSGGGKKPWRQKGTGRARVGSSRNPLWRTGGISHGPQPKNWTLKMSKNLKRLAIRSALSAKAAKNQVVVVEDLGMKKPSTKDLTRLLEKTNTFDRRTLLVLSTNDLNIRKSASNLKNVSTALVENLNAYEILLSTKIVFMKDSVEMLNNKYSTGKKKSVVTDEQKETPNEN